MSIEIVKEIEDVLTSHSNRANYPAGMVVTMLKNGGSASRTQISKYLAKINNSTDATYYRGVPVYRNNKAIQRIIETDTTATDHIYSIKMYDGLTKSEKEGLIRLAFKVAKQWEKITA